MGLAMARSIELDHLAQPTRSGAPTAMVEMVEMVETVEMVEMAGEAGVAE